MEYSSEIFLDSSFAFSISLLRATRESSAFFNSTFIRSTDNIRLCNSELSVLDELTLAS